MTQLDGLRCFAVFSVLVAHFCHDLPGIGRAGPWGGLLGVRLFFVLSGFLITQILLRERDAMRAAGVGVWTAIRPFYARRFLRIFPLYYGVLLVATALAVYPVRESLPWHLAYASNFYMAREGTWVPTVAHFWTLAMEEQFYLLWPWVVLLVRPASLPRIAIALAALAPAFRTLGWFAGWNEVAVEALPLASLDSLGAGALLAVLVHESPQRARKLVRAALWIGLPLCVVLLGAKLLRWLEPTVWILFAPALSLFLVWVIDRASRGFGGVVGRLLEARPIVYLGRISYGIYVFHLFGYAIVEYALWAWPNGLTRQELHDSAIAVYVGPGAILAMTVLTLGMAAASWHAYERPLLRLKRHFPYPGSRV